jgi:hypothetical protein
MLREKEGASLAALQLIVKSVSQAFAYSCASSSISIGRRPLVVDFMEGAKRNAVQSHKKQLLLHYPDPATILANVWLFGPNENLGIGLLRHKLVALLFIDLAFRPSDIKNLFRLHADKDGSNASLDVSADPKHQSRIRPFYPKEVKIGSSRKNSSNRVWGQWCSLPLTIPKELCTRTTLLAYLDRTNELDIVPFQDLRQLNCKARPLIHGAMWKDGVLQPPSIDYLSHLMKDLMLEIGIKDMDTRNIRGMSVSKVAQVAPTLLPEAIRMGRWTTPKTFADNYQKPVRCVSKRPLPDAVLKSKNLQQILRHGLSLKPPTNVSLGDFVRHHSHWINKKLPGVGTVRSFSEGIYSVQSDNTTKRFTHFELFSAYAGSSSKRRSAVSR